jgi:hypothetical protein
MSGVHQTTIDSYDPVRAVEYGQLVQLAYDMYGNGQSPTPAPPTPFQDGYTFTAWVQMRDFFIEEGDWTFYGFIAQRTSKANEFVLAIRGTGNNIEWLDDITSMVPVPMAGFGEVAYGFNRIYQTLRVVKPPAAQTPGAELHVRSVQPSGTFAEQVAATVRERAAATARTSDMKAEAPSAAMSIEVTGHSLGAALSTLYVAENATVGHAIIPLICTFASPRVGDAVFAAKFDQLAISSWRIVNELDLVPKLPFLGFQHVEAEHAYNSGGSVNWSLACWHSLSTYLHLIDPKEPLATECKRPPSKVGPATASLRSAATTAAAAARDSGEVDKEIAVSVPAEVGATINITIKIG